MYEKIKRDIEQAVAPYAQEGIRIVISDTSLLEFVPPEIVYKNEVICDNYSPKIGKWKAGLMEIVREKDYNEARIMCPFYIARKYECAKVEGLIFGCCRCNSPKSNESICFEVGIWGYRPWEGELFHEISFYLRNFDGKIYSDVIKAYAGNGFNNLLSYREFLKRISILPKVLGGSIHDKLIKDTTLLLRFSQCGEKIYYSIRLSPLEPQEFVPDSFTIHHFRKTVRNVNKKIDEITEYIEYALQKFLNEENI